MIVEPPLLTGAVNVTAAPAPEVDIVAAPIVGAEGESIIGPPVVVILLLTILVELVPTELVAVTINV